MSYIIKKQRILQRTTGIPPLIDSTKKRQFFWLITLASPLILLVCLEGLLRLANFGDSLNLVFLREYRGVKYYTVNRYVSRRYFPTGTIPAPAVDDCTFEAKKSAGTYRIFMLGESTMQGFPYEYNGALHQLLTDRLAPLFPGRKFEVINLGITAVNSYAVLDLMREVVQYEPDLIIVYLGHNEYYGSFGVASAESVGRSRQLINLYLRLEHFKIVQALERLVGVVRSMFGSQPSGEPSGLMVTLSQEKAIPNDDPLFQAGVDGLRRNLLEMADIAAARNVPLMFSTVACNLGDQYPFVSGFSRSTSPEERIRWSDLVNRGKKAQEGNSYDSAAALYVRALAIDSTYAGTQYDLGICLERLGRYSEARRHFLLARDCDQLRFRAPGEINAAIREVAASRHLLLADIEKTFDDSSEHFIPGRNLFLEHVHPNLNGYFLIAKEYARIMRQHDCIAPAAAWRNPLPDDEYKSRSFMTQFDFEVSFLHIDILMHRWPFSEPDSTRYKPTSVEGRLALEYLRGKTTWDKAHYTLADQYKAEGRYGDAIHEYLAIAKVMVFDPNPLLLAGDMDLVVRNYPEAVAAYRLAQLRDDNQYVDVRLGEYFAEAGKADSAIVYYTSALAKNARAESKMKQEWVLELRRHLAEEYLHQGDRFNAREQLMDILAADPSASTAKQMLDSLGPAQ